jgi:hypothetical protein
MGFGLAAVLTAEIDPKATALLLKIAAYLARHRDISNDNNWPHALG